MGPVLLLLLVLGTDLWVYLDAETRLARRRPVVAELGGLRLDTPLAWLLGCLLLWVFFLPLYLRARRG